MERMLSIREALWQAVTEEMSKDDKICVWGEGVSSKIAFDYPDLLKSFHNRIQNMPISEACIVSAGLGAALIGLKPIVDLSFDDLAPRAMDEILNQAAKVRYVTAGESKPSLIIKIDLPPVRCAQTGQRLESLFAHIPGIAIAIPSTPSDAKALMKAGLRTNDVIIFIEDRWITTKEFVHTDADLKFGTAAVRRRGKDLTLVTYGYMVKQALEVADSLSKRGIELEVLDLRTLAPIDWPSIFASVKETGRIVTLEGGWRSCGIGAEICSTLSENLMEHLHSPPLRLAMKMTHIPTSSALRMKVYPSNEEIIDSIEKIALKVEVQKISDRRHHEN
jgi:pyruvate/2-oxoglutarate/acetoin dehydrogenase E1 component